MIDVANCADVQMGQRTVERCQATLPQGLSAEGFERGGGEGIGVAEEEESGGGKDEGRRRSQERHSSLSGGEG